MMPKTTLENKQARFEAKVRVTPGCWPWLGSVDPFGYGVVGKAPTIAAHKYAYMVYVGAAPKGLLVRHKCDNPACVNPDHLELGTHKQNSNDMVMRDRAGPATITVAQVAGIKTQLRAGARQVTLGRRLKLSKYIISDIATGKTWKDVEPAKLC